MAKFALGDSDLGVMGFIDSTTPRAKSQTINPLGSALQKPRRYGSAFSNPVEARPQQIVAKPQQMNSVTQLQPLNRAAKPLQPDATLTKPMNNAPKPMSSIPGQKYAGEMHFPGYNFMGPGTRVDIRLGAGSGFAPQRGESPINKLDRAAYWHDIEYQRIGQHYNQNPNRAELKGSYMNAVHSADKAFISNALGSGIQPLGAIAAGMIGAKMLAEKSGLLSTNVFSKIK